MAVRLINQRRFSHKGDVKLVWQGGRIAKVIFSHGVVVEFFERKGKSS
ncbi:MAG: hypothetical protein ACOYD6_02615 [Limnochordia bacterium]|jgi:hypothetical protein